MYGQQVGKGGGMDRESGGGISALYENVFVHDLQR